MSVRIRKEVIDALEEAGVDVAGKTRAYLEDLAWETQGKAALADLHKIVQKGVKPADKGSAAKLVRKDRDAHR